MCSSWARAISSTSWPEFDSELAREEQIEIVVQVNGKVRGKIEVSADADQALRAFEGIPYRNPVTIGENLTCSFFEAGHILGSAIAMIRHEADGNSRTVCFSNPRRANAFFSSLLAGRRMTRPARASQG